MPESYSIIQEAPIGLYNDTEPFLIIDESKKLLLKARFWECRHYVVSNRSRLTQALKLGVLTKKSIFEGYQNPLFDSPVLFDNQFDRRSLFAEYQAFIIKKSLAASALLDIETLYESFYDLHGSVMNYFLFLKAYNKIKNYLTSDSSAIIDRTF